MFDLGDLRKKFQNKPLTPEGVTRDILAYWMLERESVRVVRSCDSLKPWTKDVILQTYRFCNTFRYDDKVTQHYLGWIGERTMATDNLLFSTLMYRLFNWPETLDKLPRIRNWRNWETRYRPRCAETLADIKASGKKMYTGAYMLTGKSIPGQEKWASTLETLDALYRKFQYKPFNIKTNSMRYVWEYLQDLPRVGGFIGYEVVTDLSYSFDFDDQNTWAFAGPGAIRGLSRIYNHSVKRKMSQPEALERMLELYQWVKENWPNSRRITMREVEHSLCEVDKYLRVKFGEGSPRAKFNGTV